MRRVFLVFGIGIILVLLTVVSSPDHRPAAKQEKSHTFVPLPVAKRGKEMSSQSVLPANSPVRRALHEGCDLPVESICDGNDCVILLHAPDLDGFSGWIDMATESPRFVVTTAARDLGFEPAWTPCGAAIGDIPNEILMIELSSGQQLWCAGTNGHNWAGVCDAYAMDTYGESGFTRPGVRRLQFRR